ncbi:hypothetical protein OAE12_00180 [bacterium]|nr:hypothetical protein [bacterium]
MSEYPSQETKPSDEIDLGQLLLLIKKGFKGLGNVVLLIFLFFKRNLFILLGLVLLGVGISFGLNNLLSKKWKTEVIVRPNFESTDYLEDVVAEIKANLKTKNESFFKTLGVKLEDTKGFDLELETISDEELESDDKMKEQMSYLEALNNFKDEGFVKDILRSELTEKSILSYKLSFHYVDFNTGPDVVNKIVEYINTNEYFNKIKEVYLFNAKARIANNTELIKQINNVIATYSNSLKSDNSNADKGFYVDKEPLNVSSLLSLKANLLKDIEEKNLELKQQSSVVNIINQGASQEVIKPFFDDRMFKIPLVLVLGFLFYRFVRYLNIKAKEIA